MSDDLDFEGYTCPVPLQPKDTVVLGHGSGGRLSHDLLNRLFLPELGKAAPRALDDSAVLTVGGERLALTTDSHVVAPLFFPGGDIGRLAVCGTVNDLAMVGATPIALTCGFVIEEGLSVDILQRVVQSMRDAAAEAGVYIAAGDTKVVQKGGADKLFINTSGVGKVPLGVDISGANACPGDVIIISGTLGDHGIAVLSARAGLRNRFTE
jgi:hydrogenase expression/formation protein HypE